MKWPRRRRRDHGPRVSASQLAQMGVCERLVVFEHRYGKRPSRAQRVALERGARAHRQFLLLANSGRRAFGGAVLESAFRVLVAWVRRFTKWCLALWPRLPGGSRDR